MNMKPGLFQQQTLKLAMTQELSQAIALLQYTSHELAAFLEEKAAENPLISLDHDQTLTTNFKNKKRTPNDKDAKYWIEQLGEDFISLERYLQMQLNIHQLDSLERKIIMYLISNLDENGYFRSSIQDVAKTMGTEIDLIDKCLKDLQALEPAGVGARNLQECLLLQLKRNHILNDTAEIILKDYFILFAEKKWKDLSKKLNISLKDIQSVLDYVQTLNPRPGAAFNQEKPSYIVPDVMVEYVNGELVVKLVESNTQKLNLNENYYKIMKASQDQKVNRFLQEKWHEYQWISKSLQQRKETILRVMSKIVEKQPECFIKGLSQLKPMTMREIGEELEIHESTVSRTVKDKFVQAPFGTVELRSFFTSNLQSVSEEDISALKAKKTMQLLIEKEDKTKPLSDQDVSDILKKDEGIILSRRTVAKYRDQLNIPSSSKRKRYE